MIFLRYLHWLNCTFSKSNKKSITEAIVIITDCRPITKDHKIIIDVLIHSINTIISDRYLIPIKHQHHAFFASYMKFHTVESHLNLVQYRITNNSSVNLHAGEILFSKMIPFFCSTYQQISKF